MKETAITTTIKLINELIGIKSWFETTPYLWRLHQNNKTGRMCPINVVILHS